jgi:hypothetical protein
MHTIQVSLPFRPSKMLAFCYVFQFFSRTQSLSTKCPHLCIKLLRYKKIKNYVLIYQLKRNLSSRIQLSTSVEIQSTFQRTTLPCSCFASTVQIEVICSSKTSVDFRRALHGIISQKTELSHPSENSESNTTTVNLTRMLATATAQGES